MSQSKNSKKFFVGFATIAIPIIVVVAVFSFIFILGNPGNFKTSPEAVSKMGSVWERSSVNFWKEAPAPDGVLGTVHSGGIIVPLLMSLLLMVITFVFERFITIFRAKGKGSIASFVANVHQLLSKGDIAQAKLKCDEQRGSVANVIRAGLGKYEEMLTADNLNKDQKLVAIKQEFEEATSLELPMLEQNLVILATISSIATLMGLLGTVLGMIKSFSAMAKTGAPDAVQLASGISEALINTALGIGTSAIAIIFYNFFTTQIDKMTYSIDEAGVALTQNFASRHN